MKVHYDLTDAPKEYREGFLAAMKAWFHHCEAQVYTGPTSEREKSYIIMVDSPANGDNATYRYVDGVVKLWATGVEE
jgi:hypothetical protein